MRSRWSTGKQPERRLRGADGGRTGASVRRDVPRPTAASSDVEHQIKAASDPAMNGASYGRNISL